MSEIAASKPQTNSNPGVFANLVSLKVGFWVVLLGALSADIASKAWADLTLRPLGDNAVSVIPGLLAWKWAENKGAAFSILDGRADILSVIAAVVLAVVFIYMYRTKPEKRLLLVAMALVASGAIGNLYDRLLLGYVRDFIFFDFDLPLHDKFSFIPRRWPVFNVADMAILGGVGVMVVISLFSKEKKEHPAAPKS